MRLTRAEGQRLVTGLFGETKGCDWSKLPELPFDPKSNEIGIGFRFGRCQARWLVDALFVEDEKILSALRSIIPPPDTSRGAWLAEVTKGVTDLGYAEWAANLAE